MTEQEWKEKHVARLIERGLTPEMAETSFEATKESGFVVLDEDPVDTADEELTYWSDDE